GGGWNARKAVDRKASPGKLLPVHVMPDGFLGSSQEILLFRPRVVISENQENLRVVQAHRFTGLLERRDQEVAYEISSSGPNGERGFGEQISAQENRGRPFANHGREQLVIAVDLSVQVRGEEAVGHVVPSMVAASILLRRLAGTSGHRRQVSAATLFLFISEVVQDISIDNHPALFLTTKAVTGSTRERASPSPLADITLLLPLRSNCFALSFRQPHTMTILAGRRMRCD